MLLGVSLNLALLLCMYWKQLSNTTVLKSEPKPQFIDLSTTNIKSFDIEEGKHQTSILAAVVAVDDPPPSGAIDNDPVVATTKSNIELSGSGSGSSSTKNIGSADPTSLTVRSCKDEAGLGMPVPNQAIGMELENAANNTGSSEGMQQGSMLDDNDEAPSGRDVGCCQHVVCVVTESPPPAHETSNMMALHAAPASCMPTTTGGSKRWKQQLWKLSVYFVTLAMLAALLAGLNLSWSTITAAIALIVLDFEDAAPSLNKVSYSLLVFFSGMFITVDGFNRTGLPGKFWSIVEPHARINHASGTAVLTAVVILLSNVASNVPTVLLLGPRVAASSMAIPGVSITRAWLILAWASTVGGNLTLVGSAANLIVSEQARMAAKVPYNLSFWRHMKFGFPSTLLTVVAGLPLIRG